MTRTLRDEMRPLTPIGWGTMCTRGFKLDALFLLVEPGTTGDGMRVVA